jgi:hypothetical protein
MAPDQKIGSDHPTKKRQLNSPALLFFTGPCSAAAGAPLSQIT